MVTRHFPGMGEMDFPGEAFPSSIDVAPKAVPANARITVRGGRGDIVVLASDQPEIRVSGKVNVQSWSENPAKRMSEHMSPAITQNPNGFSLPPPRSGRHTS